MGVKMAGDEFIVIVMSEVPEVYYSHTQPLLDIVQFAENSIPADVLILALHEEYDRRVITSGTKEGVLSSAACDRRKCFNCGKVRHIITRC